MRRRELLTGSAALATYAALTGGAGAFGLGKLGRNEGHLGAVLGTPQVPALAQAFLAQLRTGASDAILNIQSDSTGDSVTSSVLIKWPYYFAQALAAQELTHYIDFYYFNGSTFLYELKGLLGRTSPFAAMQDTFARADGALGTTSSGGQTWSANTYLISGGKAVPSVTSDQLVPAAALATSSIVLQVDLGIPTAGTQRTYFQCDAGRTMYFQINLDATNFAVFLSTASNPTQIYAKVHGLSGGSTASLKVTKDGLNVYIEFPGVQFFYTMSPADEATLTGRTVRFLSATAITGHSYDNVYIGDATKPARKLTIQNGAVSGSSMQYHRTNVATLIPVKPDLLINSLGHNDTGLAPSAFQAAYITTIQTYRTQAGDANLPILATIQNPRTDANAAAHAANMATIRPMCVSNRWDCVDAFNPFLASPLWAGGTLLQGDGIHPSTIGYQTIWEPAVAARFGLS